MLAGNLFYLSVGYNLFAFLRQKIMSITLMQGSNFDWLSDLSPLFKAQELWFDGSYHNQVSWMVDTPSDTPFTISCGAALLAEHVKRFRFSPSVIFRLGQVTDARGRSIFQESF